MDIEAMYQTTIHIFVLHILINENNIFSWKDFLTCRGDFRIKTSSFSFQAYIYIPAINLHFSN